MLTVNWTGLPQVGIMKWSERKSFKANGAFFLVSHKDDRQMTGGTTSLSHPCVKPDRFLITDGAALKSVPTDMKVWHLKNESSQSNRLKRKYPGETVYSLRMYVKDGNLNSTYCLAVSSSTTAGVELTNGSCSDNRFLFTFCEDQLLVMGNDYTNRYSECWWNFPSWLRLNP
jgi:hypothetical protein